MSVRAVPMLAVFLSTASFAGEYRIVGGQQVSPGDWADTAAICWGSQCGRWDVGCTGTLIAPDVVVTAAHCVEDGAPTHVMLGSTDHVADPGEIVRVSRATMHPSYRTSSWQGYDIAVLKLQEPARAHPRALAYGCVQDGYLVDGADAVIAGYGAHDQNGRQYDTKLREGFITITDADCSDMGTNSRPTGCIANISPGGEMGAGGGGVDACYGDSGGPLYLRTELGDYLVGVTSRAYSYAWNPPCRDGGIYVRPDAVVAWIEDTTDIVIPETTCNAPPAPEVNGVLRAPAGRERSMRIDANDPDQNSGHNYRVVRGPVHGEGSVSGNGNVSFKPFDTDYLGEDSMIVEVMDTRGYPNHAVTLVVPLEVIEGGGCGCATSPVPSTGWLAGLIGLLALRRRRD